jgi:DNA invertase Pin-like site-specific DNA recombinase
VAATGRQSAPVKSSTSQTNERRPISSAYPRTVRIPTARLTSYGLSPHPGTGTWWKSSRRLEYQAAATTAPASNACLTLARAKQIQKIVVHEISRLGRRNSVAHKFLEDVTELGVSIFWLSQQVDTLLENGKRNPMAMLMFGIPRRERPCRERIDRGADSFRDRGSTKEGCPLRKKEGNRGVRG